MGLCIVSVILSHSCTQGYITLRTSKSLLQFISNSKKNDQSVSRQFAQRDHTRNYESLAWFKGELYEF